MPNMFGGSQSHPEYAPHMWTKIDGVGTKLKRTFRFGHWKYRLAKTKDGRLVCDRADIYELADITSNAGYDHVPVNQIPPELLTKYRRAIRRRKR